MSGTVFEFMIFRLPMLLILGTILVYGVRLGRHGAGFGTVLYPDETESSVFWRSLGFLSFNIVLRAAVIIAALLMPLVMGFFRDPGPLGVPVMLVAPLALTDLWALIAGNEMARRKFYLPIVLLALPVLADAAAWACLASGAHPVRLT